MVDKQAKVAVAQVQSAREPAANLSTARRLTDQAADNGVDMIVFPEYFMSWGDGRHGLTEMRAVAEPLDGPIVTGLRQLAKSHGIWLIAGTIEARAGADARPLNTTVVIADDGELKAAYRKTHLFDAFNNRESAAFGRGDGLAPIIESPAGPLGVFVCYELRFPEVARSLALAGAEILIVPSGWVAGLLKDMHWETLLRARAIENGCYVVAAAQVGNEFAGQSMVLDPMGVVTTSAGEQETLLFAEIDGSRVRSTRKTVGSLARRRPELYRS